MTDAEPEASLPSLALGSLDLVLADQYPFVPMPPDERLEIEPLLQERFHLMLPAGHPLAASGEVWCWGANYVNQVDPSRSDVYTPVRKPLPLAATNVAVSDSGSCALLSDGQRACWLSGNAETELGFEIESSPRFERLLPALPANCGMTHDQELVCGGYNLFGVLGFPMNLQPKVGEDLPHRVVPLPRPVKEVAAPNTEIPVESRTDRRAPVTFTSRSGAEWPRGLHPAMRRGGPARDRSIRSVWRQRRSCCFAEPMVRSVPRIGYGHSPGVTGPLRPRMRRTARSQV